jgi:hypothetical protein
MEEAPVTPVDPPKKRRGWPKGKPRGPRKPVAFPPSQEPIPTPAPSPPTPQPAYDPETEVELVSVSAHLSSGRDLAFRCSVWEEGPGSWKFISFPRRRGYKTLRVLRALDLASLEIEAPEPFFDKFKASPAPFPEPVTIPFGTAGTYPAPVPVMHVSPVAQIVRDTKANQARRVGQGVKSEIVGEEGGRAVVNATMLGSGEV